MKHKHEYNPENHTYKIDDNIVPCVSDVLKWNGYYQYLKFVKDEDVERARINGKAIHKACELYDIDKLNYVTIDPGLLPFVENWRHFQTNYNITSFIEIEKTIFSDKYLFGGTPDRIAIVKDKLTIIDIKTSATSNPAEALQLGAYSILWNEQKKGKIKKIMSIHLTKEGINLIEFLEPIEKYQQVFLAHLTVYNYKKRQGIL